MDVVAILSAIGIDWKVVIGVAVTAACAYAKREIDMRGVAREKASAREQERLDKEHANELAKLDLTAQQLVMEQELLAEKKRRTTGRPTPTGLRHQTVKRALSESFPLLASGVIDARIREHARTASASVKTIAPSIMPTPSESAQQLAAVVVPRDEPPPIPRPSGDHDSVIEFDLPEDDATLDDGGEK